MSFNVQEFIQSCVSANDTASATEQITNLVKGAVLETSSIFDQIGKPSRAMIEKLYVSHELTIINVVWAPKMTLLPHNHNTWAVIGVYAGREDNIFWRRLKGDPNGKIEAAGAKSISAGEVAALGKNIIHSVTNPTPTFTGAIHVYGGNFFEIDRSEWDPTTLTECPYNVEKNVGLFEAENEILKLRGKTTP